MPIINIQICYILATKICSGIRFSDTGSETFSGTTFSQYRFRDFFSGSNLFQYLKKNEKFPVPGIPGTGTSHSCSRLTGQFLWFHCVLSIATVRSDLILKLPTKSSSQDKPEAQKKILNWYRLCPTHIYGAQGHYLLLVIDDNPHCHDCNQCSNGVNWVMSQC